MTWLYIALYSFVLVTLAGLVGFSIGWSKGYSEGIDVGRNIESGEAMRRMGYPQKR